MNSSELKYLFGHTACVRQTLRSKTRRLMLLTEFEDSGKVTKRSLKEHCRERVCDHQCPACSNHFTLQKFRSWRPGFHVERNLCKVVQKFRLKTIYLSGGYASLSCFINACNTMGNKSKIKKNLEVNLKMWIHNRSYKLYNVWGNIVLLCTITPH